MAHQLIDTSHPATTGWWSLRLIFQCDRPVTENEAEDLHTLLSSVHASVSLEETGRVSVQASAEAATLEAAVSRVLPLTAEAFHRTGVSAVLQVIDALSEEEFDLQQEQADAERRIPDLYGHQDIASVLDITPAEAAALVHSKDWKEVTTPVHTLRSGPLYTLSQIQEYQASRNDGA